MTIDEIALRELLEKGSDADLLREMIGFVAERLMALDIETLCGAGRGERTPSRINQRNGFRERPWETRAGTVELKICKLRVEGSIPFTRSNFLNELAFSNVPRSRARLRPRVAG